MKDVNSKSSIKVTVGGSFDKCSVMVDNDEATAIFMETNIMAKGLTLDTTDLATDYIMSPPFFYQGKRHPRLTTSPLER